jgi:hypothetical protein
MRLLRSFDENYFSEIFIVVSEKNEDDEYISVCVKFKEFVLNNYSEDNLDKIHFFDNYESNSIYYVNSGNITLSVKNILDINVLYNINYDYKTNENTNSGYTEESLEKDIKNYLDHINNESKKVFNNIKRLAVEYYGEEFVDFNEFDFTILYPEIIIENSHGKKHLIKELYVNLNLEEGCISNIKGLRGHLSLKEYNSNYLHSHLRPRNSTSYHNFCLGENTPISNFRHIKLDSDELILSFFTTLDAYVRWESLEGGPYIRIQSIGDNTGLNLSNIILKKNLKRFLIRYKNELFLTYNLVKNKLEVDVNLITPLINKISTVIGKELSQGNFEIFSNEKYEEYKCVNTINLLEKFKEKYIDLKIYSGISDKEKETKSLIDYSTLIAHPKIKNYIIKQINTKLNELNYVKFTKIVAEALSSGK